MSWGWTHAGMGATSLVQIGSTVFELEVAPGERAFGILRQLGLPQHQPGRQLVLRTVPQGRLIRARPRVISRAGETPAPDSVQFELVDLSDPDYDPDLSALDRVVTVPGG